MIRVAPILSLLLLALNGNTAPFQNLGFDDANTTHIFDCSGFGDYCGPTAELLPGWQGLGSLMGYNLFPPGLGFTTIVSNDRHYLQGYPVSGQYSLLLAPARDPFRPYSIFQTGEIPMGATTINFVEYGSPFELRLNGTVVPLVYDYLPNTIRFFDPRERPAYVTGDISAFAGATVELRLTTVENTMSSEYGIDGISFSTIPEPQTLSLLLVGISAFVINRRRDRVKLGRPSPDEHEGVPQ